MGLALRAQHVFARHVDEGRLLFLVASALAVSGMLLIDSASPKLAPSEASSGTQRVRSSRRVLAAGVLVALSLLASLATYESANSGRVVWPATLWVVSLLLATLGVAIWSRGRPRLPRPHLPRLRRAQLLDVALLAGILALALALRLPKLAAIPPDVHGDEAAIGNDARALLQGGWNQLFRLGWAELPQLGYASVAVVMRVFGDDLYGLRMSSVIAGVLSVFLLYLIVRRAFGRRPALLAAFVLAVAQWHIQFSRTGFHYIQALLATLTVFFFALRALDNRQELDFLFTGFSVGLCLIVYYAARVVPILLALYLLYRILRERGFLRANLLGFACLMLGACVFLAPQLASYEHSPGEWSSRSNAVWLFSPDVLAHERQVYGVQSEARIVAIQAERTIESINRIGETSVQYGRPGRPLFDFWSAALLVPGVLYAMSRARQSRYFLLTVWLWVPLVLGVMLTVDAPASPRMIVVLPVLAVFPALVVDAGWRATEQLSGRTGQVAFGALVVALGALILHANYHDYFQQQVTKLRVAGYFTLLSQYARHVNGRDRIYLVSADNSLGYDTVRFLVPHLDGEYLGPDPGLPLTGEPRGKGGAFVLSYSAPDWAKTLATLQRAYPGGVRESHTDAAGVLEFTSYEVGAAELSRTPG